MSLLFKTRNQLNDFFSEFRRYIAPTYYHDRCERSLHMNIYAIHKREILLSLAGFLSCFILLLFIGLAGPNVTKLDTLKASQIFEKDKVNKTVQQNLLVSGPFRISVPEMSTYSGYICLWITFYIKGEPDSGAFQKRFTITINIEGKSTINNNNHHRKDTGSMGFGGTNDTLPMVNTILEESFDSGGGRYHHLDCNGNSCDPIQALHLEYLEYSDYTITIRFADLEHFNKKNPITDIHFTFQSINPSFTSLTIWFRFIFLVIAFITSCWFNHCLYRYNFADWSMEQKWTSFLLIALILYNNPFYPLMYLSNSKFPHILEILFQTTFTCSVLLFWICFFHGIRQNNRPLIRFYGFKLLIVGTLWLIILYGANWSRIKKMENPTLDEETAYSGSMLLKTCNFLFYLLFLIYFIYLVLLLLTAFTELRSMPYFDLRLKIQTFLLCFTLTICFLEFILSKPPTASDSILGKTDITQIPYLQLLPMTYQTTSSASFLSIFSISNLYICIAAYFYYPSSASLMDSRVVRDNPTLSMINDSDEDVIYGSDVEQPLNQSKLIEMRNDDEESD
ncbi:transmembrane protein 181-like [Panonychus citri]|uniref:transmembrane protein 181-like n=1 Tax=Panonychus citri TaxID=50023 RepID=UPI0023075076|nr:transmembrane protein 181-like [Panonychus citri]